MSAAARVDIAAADGTPIAVWVAGTGPALVLVHGSIADHTTFDPFVAMLGTRRGGDLRRTCPGVHGARPLRPQDRPGHGHRHHPRSAQMSTARPRQRANAERRWPRCPRRTRTRPRNDEGPANAGPS